MSMQQIDYVRAWIGAHIKNERGAVATEYAVLVAFLVVLIVAGAVLFGGALRDWLKGLVTEVKSQPKG